MCEESLLSTAKVTLITAALKWLQVPGTVNIEGNRVKPHQLKNNFQWHKLCLNCSLNKYHFVEKSLGWTYAKLKHKTSTTFPIDPKHKIYVTIISPNAVNCQYPINADVSFTNWECNRNPLWGCPLVDNHETYWLNQLKRSGFVSLYSVGGKITVQTTIPSCLKTQFKPKINKKQE